MNNSNHLISSDNKGYAEYLFERHMSGNATMNFKDIPFVAAFAQRYEHAYNSGMKSNIYISNEGDVSPNTRGPHCPDGTPCANDSTCNGKNEQCIASGPGVDMFDSTKIIGTSNLYYIPDSNSSQEPINSRKLLKSLIPPTNSLLDPSMFATFS